MLRSICVLAPFLVACATDAGEPKPDPPETETPPSRGVSVLFGPTVTVTPIGPAVAGAMSGWAEWNGGGPSSDGNGSYAVEIDGTAFAGGGERHVSASEYEADDPAGGPPLKFLGFKIIDWAYPSELEVQTTEAYVFVPQSDHAPGATIVFDGDLRFGWFQQYTEQEGAIIGSALYGAAFTGSITFAPDSSLDTSLPGMQKVVATVNADFGRVDVTF